MKPIKVKVRDLNGVIFEGEVDRISSFNEVGPFDVYPMHANFISIVRKSMAFYLHRRKINEIKFAYAVMKVKRDSVNVFVGIEEMVVAEENMVGHAVKT